MRSAAVKSPARYEDLLAVPAHLVAEIQIPATAFLSLAPDWVCEILSPATETMDRVTKLAIYARESVGHVWLINPVARTLEVPELDGARWTLLATHGGTVVVRAAPFETVPFDLGALWSGTADPVP